MVNANCSNARSNLTVLAGRQARSAIDEDKDGKPDRNLNDTERADRADLAEGPGQDCIAVAPTVASGD